MSPGRPALKHVAITVMPYFQANEFEFEHKFRGLRWTRYPKLKRTSFVPYEIEYIVTCGTTEAGAVRTVRNQGRDRQQSLLE